MDQVPPIPESIDRALVAAEHRIRVAGALESQLAQAQVELESWRRRADRNGARAELLHVAEQLREVARQTAAGSPYAGVLPDVALCLEMRAHKLADGEIPPAGPR